MSDAPAPLVVVAAVIEQEDRFLVTRRLAGTHLEGFWEFPGGKCEPGESHEHCLVREIDEEIGARIEVGREICTVTHDYGDRQIHLHFRACRLLGPARPRLGQEMRWVARTALRTLPFPPADRELIERLSREDGC
ncbi:MAG TPA: (deoxy)nucleoside triphosphate pyrophosphohydrolase [Vicinamibacterales bacterium]|nr:(deoxy)nucleoside triphosphate pyrophosphohydrolase [Vicinamibacterales bacterium]